MNVKLFLSVNKSQKKKISIFKNNIFLSVFSSFLSRDAIEWSVRYLRCVYKRATHQTLTRCVTLQHSESMFLKRKTFLMDLIGAELKVTGFSWEKKEEERSNGKRRKESKKSSWCSDQLSGNIWTSLKCFQCVNFSNALKRCEEMSGTKLEKCKNKHWYDKRSSFVILISKNCFFFYLKFIKLKANCINILLN